MVSVKREIILLTAKEYFDKYETRILKASIDELSAIIGEIWLQMSKEVYESCVASDLKEDKDIIDFMKAQNCKWNDFVDVFHEQTHTTNVLDKDKFIQLWVKRMPEMEELAK